MWKLWNVSLWIKQENVCVYIIKNIIMDLHQCWPVMFFRNNLKSLYGSVTYEQLLEPDQCRISETDLDNYIWELKAALINVFTLSIDPITVCNVNTLYDEHTKNYPNPAIPLSSTEILFFSSSFWFSSSHFYIWFSLSILISLVSNRQLFSVEKALRDFIIYEGGMSNNVLSTGEGFTFVTLAWGRGIQI